MSEKKRKRHGNGGDRPSKKAAVAQTPGNVRFDFVENDDFLSPVLAVTPGLNFPKVDFRPYKKTTILPQGTTTEMILQSSDHPRMDYIAREDKHGSIENLLKDWVGVYDPATGKLQLMEVPRVTLRSTLRCEMDEMREENERIAAMKGSNTARRHALATEFGSKKSKKAIADMTENAIARSRTGEASAGAKDENISAAVLKNMSGVTNAMPTKEDLAALIDSSKPRPQPNLAAEYPPDVYSLDTLIGKDLMAIIEVKDWIDAAEAGEDVSVASKFVAKRLMKLARAKDVKKLKVLWFILLCINFSAALKNVGKGPKRIPPKDKLVGLMGENVPVPLVDAIRRKFASENNDMTRWHVDNLMTHVAAAALTVDNYEVDVNDLREDLKVENREIKQYFHEIGCKITPPTETDRTKWKISKAEAVNHFVAKLKIPLTFPKVKTGPSKRIRR